MDAARQQVERRPGSAADHAPLLFTLQLFGGDVAAAEAELAPLSAADRAVYDQALAAWQGLPGAEAALQQLAARHPLELDPRHVVPAGRGPPRRAGPRRPVRDWTWLADGFAAGPPVARVVLGQPLPLPAGCGPVRVALSAAGAGRAGHRHPAADRVPGSLLRTRSLGSRIALRYHCPDAPPTLGSGAMIRRYAFWLRALLMLVDGLLAVGLLVVLSVLRFGPDWAFWWRLVISEPLAFLALYAFGWVGVLAYHGLYRRVPAGASVPRRRTWPAPRLSWRWCGSGPVPVQGPRREPALPPVSLPDPVRPGTDDTGRAPGRLPVVARARLQREVRRHRGRRPGVRLSRLKLLEHPELGLRIAGFVDDEEFDLTAGWSLLGRLEDLPSILHERVVDEVVICLPFSQWNLVDAIARISEEEGKIVRVPMDVLDHAFAAGKMEEAGWDTGLLARLWTGSDPCPGGQARRGLGQRRPGAHPSEPALRLRRRAGPA